MSAALETLQQDLFQLTGAMGPKNRARAELAVSQCDFDSLINARVLTKAGSVHGGTFQKAKRAKYADVINRIEGVLLAVHNERALKNLNKTGAAIYELYNLYRRAHDHLKYRRGLVSFADLAKGSQRLFLGEAGQGARYMLARGVEHFLLDEFQDTSRLQWGVFSELVGELISGASVHDDAPIAPTLFLVGDVKQSIYGFREADPDVMVEAIASLQDYVHIAPLNESYRTAQVVLDYINQVFRTGQLVDFTIHRTAKTLSTPVESAVTDTVNNGTTENGTTENGTTENDTTENDTTENDTETTTADTPVVPNIGRVLVTPTFIAETAEEARVEEASYLADYLARALSEPDSHPVFDKATGTLRPLRPADCVVLYRNSTYTDTFETALRSAGLHVEREESRGFFARQEIKDLRAFLQFLAFPTDSAALCHFLQSPFGGQSDEVIFEMLGATRRESAVDRSALVLDLLADHEPALATTLTALQDRVDHCLPHQLLGEIYSELGVLGLVSRGWFPTAEEGDLARRNLLRLVELCMDAEAEGALSLTAVIAQLNYLAETDKEGNAAGSTTGVTMMTIHKSKGLEFPLVCLVDCGRPWAKTDPYWAKVDGTEAGLSPLQNQSGLNVQVRHPGIAYIAKGGLQPRQDAAFDALKKTAEAQQTSETERVLYVALTRAKQYLLISGHRGDAKAGKGLTTTVVGERLFRAAREAQLSQGENCWDFERHLRAGLEGAAGISTVPPRGPLSQDTELPYPTQEKIIPEPREKIIPEPREKIRAEPREKSGDLSYELILSPDSSLPPETKLLAPSGKGGDLPAPDGNERLSAKSATDLPLRDTNAAPSRYESEANGPQNLGLPDAQVEYLRELSSEAIKLLLPDGKTARDLAIARGLFIHQALEYWIKGLPFAHVGAWQTAKAAAGIGLTCEPRAEDEALSAALAEIERVKVSSTFASYAKGLKNLWRKHTLFTAAGDGSSTAQ